MFSFAVNDNLDNMNCCTVFAGERNALLCASMKLAHLKFNLKFYFKVKLFTNICL